SLFGRNRTIAILARSEATKQSRTVLRARRVTAQCRAPETPPVSRPPVVNPVLSRQHALGAHGPDREVARVSRRAAQMIDHAVSSRGALNTHHARAAQPRVALQRGRNGGSVFRRSLAETSGENRGILDR